MSDSHRVPVHVSSAAEFQALLAANTLVIADFYADWCPPCKAIAPVFEKLAADHSSPGRLAFAKVNVDEISSIAGAYGVTAMPTFLFFKDGQPGPVAVPGVQGGGVVMSQAGIQAIRGANPKALSAVAAELGRVAPLLPAATAAAQ